MSSKKVGHKKAYVVAVDMGYGHQRAAYPLEDMAEGGIINANRYAGIPKTDENMWEGSRKLYERISRLKNLPLIGEWIFSLMDYFQRIQSFYPWRNLSKPSLQVRQIYRMIKKGWGRDLIEKFNKQPLPLITTFFAVAFFAEEHNYHEEIYLIICDADCSRAWAPLNPQKTRIKYLVPNRRVKERLEEYGIRQENIFITGFPLPKDNIGGENLAILKASLAHRIVHLDPEKRFQKKYEKTIKEFLKGFYVATDKIDEPLSITFAVGGAGAQKEIGAMILRSLRDNIDKGKVKLNLVAGVRNDVYLYYQSLVKELGLLKKNNNQVSILYADNKMDYFAKFSELLLTTDILWTKPSELSFYAGLGLPIIMSPTVGAQEVLNREWLVAIGAGVDQEDPQYTHEWLFDWLKSGWLAEAALHGFLDAPRKGAYHIEEIVLKGKKSEIEDIHLL